MTEAKYLIRYWSQLGQYWTARLVYLDELASLANSGKPMFYKHNSRVIYLRYGSGWRYRDNKV